MSASSWFVIIFWGGPALVGSLIFLWSELFPGPVDTFERQRAEAARWMRENWVGLGHWWRPHVLTDLNVNPSPDLPSDVAVYLFMDLTQRGLLVPDIVPEEIDIEGQKVVVHSTAFRINPRRESEWNEIINISPIHVFWRKHGVFTVQMVFGAILGAILGLIFDFMWGSSQQTQPNRVAAPVQAVTNPR